MLVDTDVLVWYLRGYNEARVVIKQLPGFSISVVTYIELVQGMRNKQELIELKRNLNQWNTKILYLTEEISIKASDYVDQYYLSHSMQLGDALIAATAAVNEREVFTGNVKHYRFLPDISVKEFKLSAD
jgi:predicted nucleic acid-binding protein